MSSCRDGDDTLLARGMFLSLSGSLCCENYDFMTCGKAARDLLLMVEVSTRILIERKTKSTNCWDDKQRQLNSKLLSSNIN